MQLTSPLRIDLYSSKDLVNIGSDSSQCCLTSEFIEVLQSTEITCIVDNCFSRYTEFSWILHVVRMGNFFNSLLVSGQGSNEKTLQRLTKEIPFMHSATFVSASLKPCLQIITLRDSRSGIEPYPSRTGEEPVSRKRGNEKKTQLQHSLNPPDDGMQSLIRKASKSQIGPVSDSNLKIFR